MACWKQPVAAMAALMDAAVVDTGESPSMAAAEESMKFLLQHQQQPHQQVYEDEGPYVDYCAHQVGPTPLLVAIGLEAGSFYLLH